MSGWKKFASRNPAGTGPMCFDGTILQEVQRVQFEKLCRLLTTTDDSISGIIAACGFGSLSRAKISFRKRFGMSMRDYRKKAKG